MTRDATTESAAIGRRFLRTVFMCFDWRILAGFAAVDLGLVAASPHLALDAIPVELVLLCPISAVTMVRRMNAERRARAASSEEDPRPAAAIRTTL